MNGIIEWFAKNPVAANLLAVGIIAAGIVSMASVTQEVFPQIELDVIAVSMVYPGATPKEIEDSICSRIDEALSGMEGIKRTTAVASESVGVVSVELEIDADARKLLDDVKTKIDSITTFPPQAEKPIVRRAEVQSQVISIAIQGMAPERAIKELAEQIRRDLLAQPSISSVQVVSVRPYEISIEVSEAALRRHQLSFNDVVRAVRNSSLDLPAGSIKTAGGDVLIRTVGQAYSEHEFETIPLLARPDGSRVLLGDVGIVRDSFADTDQSARFNDEPAALVQVFRVGNQSAIDVADAVKAFVADAKERMPEGITLTIWKDDTRVLRSRLDTLTNNGISGLMLVLLILALFLKLRVAGWVAVGIPISFLGAMWLMPMGDVTINVISLFAFIVVLGIVVDDAIVVGESIYTQRRGMTDSLFAAIKGAQVVAVPVIFGVLTTIVAFLPAMFVPGATGKVWKVMPVVVIAALVFSLVESLLVLPAHLSHIPLGDKPRHPWSPIGLWNRFQEGVATGLERFVANVYRPALSWALHWRYLTLSVGAAIFIVSIGAVGGNFVKFEFFPAIEADEVQVNIRMPEGTPVATTRQIIERIEQAAIDLKAELRAEAQTDQIVNVLSLVGEQVMRNRRDAAPTGANLGAVQIELAPAENRVLSSERIMNRLRAMVGDVPGAEEVSYNASLSSAGDPVNIQLTGPDIDELVIVAGKVKAELATFSGVFDISDNFEQGKRELRLQATAAGQALGLTNLEIGRQVRQGFYGEEAQRVQRGREDIKVMVRYPEHERRSLGYLEDMRIRTPDGREVPFAFAATASDGDAPSKRTRVNRQSAINVTADIDTAVANANAVTREMTTTRLPAILAEHPQVRFSLEGEQREQADTLRALGVGFLLALIAIYGLLAIPLKSYVQPVLIMLAIPFGIIGAVLGHWVMGINLSMLSVIGIVALAGVVVNSSLVLIDFVNRYRRDHDMSPSDAVIDASLIRFRPIVLTSLTTFGGLTPIMMERSLQAQFLIPMAVSLAFGVVFSTAITLFIVPASYVVLDDFHRLPGRLAALYHREYLALKARVFPPATRPFAAPVAAPADDGAEQPVRYRPHDS